jgi:putative ABC transport system permease protein
VIRLGARAGLRHFRRHPWQLALAALGVALGVALAVGIDVATASVRRAFQLSSEAVAGRSTHFVAGGPSGVDERIYRALRLAADRPDGLELAPFVGGSAVPARGGGVLQILGVDVFAEGPFRQAAAAVAPGRVAGSAALLTLPGAAVISDDTARALGVGSGDALPVRVGARHAALKVAAVRAPADAAERRALERVAVVDIATAQELLDTGPRLLRIDLVVPPAPRADAALAWLRARLPADVRVEAVAARQGTLAQMTSAFDLNLRALSLLALLVGAFLIYNAMRFSVIQRRPTLAILRTLGATRGEIARSLLLEAAVLGLAGSAAGVALGALLARGLVGLVARAVSDLYFAVSVTGVSLDVPRLARGLGLGVAAAIGAALPAAHDATTTVPTLVLHRSSIERQARAAAPRVALGALALIAAAGGLLAASGQSLPLALTALLALLVGCAGLVPPVVLVAARAAAGVLGALRGGTGRLAARGLAAGLSRTGVAVGALTLVLSVTTGLGVMVGSFRHAVERWLEGTLRADVFVSAPASVSTRPDSVLPPSLAARLRALPGVASLGTNRVVSVATDGDPVTLMALDLAPGRDPGTELIEGEPARAWSAFATGDGALVSEPLAYRRRLRVGDRFFVATDRGRQALPVAGVYRDYASDRGAVMLSRRAYDRLFDDRRVTAIALHAEPGVSADALAAQVRAALGPEDAVMVRPARALRDVSLQIFDRTFEITNVLRLFAIIVAAFGVAGSLMAVSLERGRELATLRALGATPAQVVEVTIVETGLLGALAGLLAIPLGAVLAAFLVFVINRRSFGWTMPLVLDARALLVAPLVGMVAGVAAGLLPAWRAARVPPAEALREE